MGLDPQFPQPTHTSHTPAPPPTQHTPKRHQGHYKCAPGLLLGRPSNVNQLAALVRLYPRVKAAGVGHNWAPELTCAGNGSEAIQVLPTEFDALRRA